MHPHRGVRFDFLALLALFALSATVAGAQPAAPLRRPSEARPARHPSWNRHALVDCAAHGVWTPPEGWTSFATASSEQAALSADGRTMIVRGARRTRVESDSDFVATVDRLVTMLTGASPMLGPPTEVRPHGPRGAHPRSTVLDGEARVAGTSIRVHAASYRGRELWLLLTASPDGSSTAASLDEPLREVIASWTPLRAHACLCGDDCDH